MIQFAKCLPEGNQSFATYRSPVGAQLGLRAKISAAASGKARGGTGWNWLSGFNSPTSWRRLWWYSGWKKSCTTLDGWNPLNNGIKHLSAGARFRNHPQYHGNYSGDILFHHGDIILCHMVITCNNSGITESPKSYDSFLCVWKMVNVSYNVGPPSYKLVICVPFTIVKLEFCAPTERDFVAGGLTLQS